MTRGNKILLKQFIPVRIVTFPSDELIPERWLLFSSEVSAIPTERKLT